MHRWHDHNYIKSQQTLTVNDRSHMHKPTSNWRASIWPTIPSLQGEAVRVSCRGCSQLVKCTQYTETYDHTNKFYKGGLLHFWAWNGTVIPSSKHYLQVSLRRVKRMLFEQTTSFWLINTAEPFLFSKKSSKLTDSLKARSS